MEAEGWGPVLEDWQRDCIEGARKGVGGLVLGTGGLVLGI